MSRPKANTSQMPPVTIDLAAALGDPDARAQLEPSGYLALEAVPPLEWGPHLTSVPTPELLRGAVAAVRTVLPEWKAARPDDRRPEMAVEGAEEWLARPAPNLAEHARLVARECTKARADSLGYEHQIAEAARAVAQVPSARSDEAARTLEFEAIAKVEEYRLYRYSIDAIYGKEEEVRQAILATLRGVLLSKA